MEIKRIMFVGYAIVVVGTKDEEVIIPVMVGQKYAAALNAYDNKQFTMQKSSLEIWFLMNSVREFFKRDEMLEKHKYNKCYPAVSGVGLCAADHLDVKLPDGSWFFLERTNEELLML